MTLATLLVLGVSVRTPARAQQAAAASKALSDRLVSYTIDARLNPDARTIQGRQRLTWRNPDRVPVDELQFHLYLNAFKNERSTFMRESDGRHRGFAPEDENPWGGIDVTRMQLVPPHEGDRQPMASRAEAAADLTDRIRIIQPDDFNPDDETVIAVTLPHPVGPGETVTLDVDFDARLPEIFARTGWEKKPDGTLFFLVGQWFPKLGVYEVPGQRYVAADAPHGQWNTHQFHANSEFYADFGTYDVTITVPGHYRVGATGLRVGERQTDSLRTLTYHAEDVHDFAWTASPAFREYTDQWRHVALRLLLQPEHEAQAQRHFVAAKTALEYFDRWVGPYPYATLTLVDGLGGSNGMEYPTLITCGTVYMLPAWARVPEVVTIHEFGHQYFYGMLASNEFEEAWLDEGINSYLEMRILDDAYGPVIDFPGLRITDGAYQRLSYAKSNVTRYPIFRNSWEYATSGDYAKASYAKPAVVLKTLEQYLGWDLMQDVLQTYYQRWRFRHPTTRDFIAVAEDVSNQDLDWFFDQYVYGTVAVDYAVDRLWNGLPGEASEADTSEVPAGENGQAALETPSTVAQSEVWVQRKGEGYFPQTLRVRFADGTTEDIAWDGRDEWKRFVFDRRIAEAYLDPDNKVWLDVNRLNNRRVAEPDPVLGRKAQFKATVWLQQFFYVLSGLL